MIPEILHTSDVYCFIDAELVVGLGAFVIALLVFSACNRCKVACPGALSAA
jgi:hypothetical protein